LDILEFVVSNQLRAWFGVAVGHAVSGTEVVSGARLFALGGSSVSFGPNMVMVGPLPHWAKALGLLQNADNILADPNIALLGPILANIWFGIPFFAITLLATLTAIPREMYEAANIDGGSTWQQFRFITLPYIAPTLVITALLRTVWIANFSDLIWVMTKGGPADTTQITSSFIFSLANDKLDYGYAAAVSVILLVLLVIYAVFMLRLRARFERAM
jgi:multiple sugar transport system permease protein